MKVVTWNTQGNPLSKEPDNSKAPRDPNAKRKHAPQIKSNIINYLFKDAGADFICLQEAGNPDKWDDSSKADVAASSSQAGAKNLRCTTAILYNHHNKNIKPLSEEKCYSLPSSTGRFAVFRVFQYTKDTFNYQFVLCSLHAQSGNEAGVDRSGIIQYLEKTYKGLQFIIGADWNMAPNETNWGRIHNKAYIYPKNQIIHHADDIPSAGIMSGPGTHKCRKTLDYFFVSPGIAPKQKKCTRVPVNVSDHVPVMLSINIAP